VNKSPLVALALAGLLASGAANAQFFGTIGYTNVNPKSGNGTLAGADANVNDAWSATGSIGYRFNPNFNAELGTALIPFKHDVSLDGLGTVASLEHRPTILSVNYRFLPEGKVRPFVRLGYGWVSISNEKSKGALTGLEVGASGSNGLVYGGGVDFAVSDKVFVRADLYKLDFDTKVSVETLGNVGTANVDPLVFGLSLGYEF